MSTTIQTQAAQAADQFIDQLEQSFYGQVRDTIQRRSIEREFSEFTVRCELLQQQYDTILQSERQIRRRLKSAKPADRVTLEGQIRVLRQQRANVMVQMGAESFENALEAIQVQAKEEEQAALEASEQRAAKQLTEAASSAKPKAIGTGNTPAKPKAKPKPATAGKKK